MKKTALFFNLFLLVFLIACSPNKVEKNSIENISFTVDNTQLSQNYQSKESFAQFLSNSDNLDQKEEIKIFLSLGPMESSGLNIKEITRSGSEISIYVDSIFEEDNLQLAVPQAILLVKSSDFEEPLDEYVFKVINDNSKLLNINIDMNDAISKVESHFKLASNISPKVQLIKKDNKLLWSLDYPAAFDKEEESIPLVKFSAEIDADDGSIIGSDKELIAKPIDNGKILNIKTDNYILYKKTIDLPRTDNKKEELWIYNINTNKSELLFTSDYTIKSTQFSPDLSYISLIETSDINNNLYLIPTRTKKAYKIALEDGFSPSLDIWKDRYNLVLVERVKNKSKLARYNLTKEKVEEVINIDMDIKSIISNGSSYIFTEEIDKGLNENIYFTKDFKNIDKITLGYKPEFITNNLIVYLEDIEKKDTNYIKIYSLKDKDNIYSLEGCIEEVQVPSKDQLYFIKKEENHNNYSLNRLSIRDILNLKGKTIEPEFISNSISGQVYYNKNYKLFYLNVNLPFEHEFNNLIYLVDII